MRISAPGPLHFDFAAPDGTIEGVTFAPPTRVIEASTLEAVRGAMRDVDRALADGWHVAGFVAYEAAPAFDLALSAHPPTDLPLVWFAVCGEPRVIRARDDGQPTDIVDGRPTIDPPAWTSRVSADDHRRAVETVRDAIAAGDVYQANVTFPLDAAIDTDTLDARYAALRAAHRVPYAAALDLGRWRVLSLSPELFFRIDRARIATRPMKGTAARGRWSGEDVARRTWLQTSEKNRAENVMIVDLARNDIGRIAEVGSVVVTTLFDIERYPSAFQMASTVEGRLREGMTLGDVFGALFPPGSVTGAPKVSATRLIAEVEPHPRGLYCGTIGYATPDGRAVFNVAIRTAVADVSTGRITCGIGGGITWDSMADEEYAEAWQKAGFLVAPPTFDLVETLRLEDGRLVRRDRHLSRLGASADYFGWRLDAAAIDDALETHIREVPHGIRRVRLTVDPDGRPTVTSQPFTPRASYAPPERVVFARAPIARKDRFLFHKTTHRTAYEHHRAMLPLDVFDVLLWNEVGELTEFTVGNLVVGLDGQRLTPPRTSGLLAGVFRQELLEACTLRERVITREDLAQAEAIWLVNSLREWVPVAFQHGASTTMRQYRP